MAFYITWYILLWCDITMLYTLRTTCFFFFTFPVILLTNKIEYKITIRFPHSAMIKVYCDNKTSSLSAIESWQLFFLIFWQYVHKHVSLHIVMIKVYFGKCVLTTLCFRHLSAIQNTMYVCMYVYMTAQLHVFLTHTQALKCITFDTTLYAPCFSVICNIYIKSIYC